MKQVVGTDTQYCCLGVLCDIINKGGWSEKNGSYFFENGAFSGAFDLLVAQKYNIEDVYEKQDDLIDMNDSKGKTFTEISKFIERTF